MTPKTPSSLIPGSERCNSAAEVGANANVALKRTTERVTGTKFAAGGRRDAAD